MSDAELVQLPPGTLVQDRYLVMRPVGQGGLSTVYQVSDTQAVGSQIFALKEQLDLSQAARKQFSREAGWLKALDHPHIPKVTAFFEWRGRLYLVMEFIAGENLEQKVERAGGRPLPQSQVLPWVLPICDALNYLHTRVPPILHRDVKPANIIVTPMGRPVLVDLGIAKEHGPVANKTATFVRKAGTEGYAPPEQYAAAGLSGPWSDVYGFGATVYHLLTAQVPSTAVERVALDAHLAPPSAYNPTVSKSTDTAIMRALAVRPQDRFPSMVHLKAALLSATSGPLAPSPAQRAPATPTAWSGALPNLEKARVVTPALASSAPPGSGPHAAAGPWQAPDALTGPAAALLPAAGALQATGPRSGRFARPIDGPVNKEAESRQPDAGRAVFWWAALAAVALLAVAAAAVVLHVYAPLDRSTPAATVAGYFTALRNQDYARAWQYTSASTNDPTSQDSWVRIEQADDTLNGRVLSFDIVPPQQSGSTHETVVVTVTRSGSPPGAVQEKVQLTQYGGNWLIDNVVPG